MKQKSSRPTPSVDFIVGEVANKFRCFGGGHVPFGDPIAHVLRNKPAQFAAGVDVKKVVTFVLAQTNGTWHYYVLLLHDLAHAKNLLRYFVWEAENSRSGMHALQSKRPTPEQRTFVKMIDEAYRCLRL